MLPFLKVFLYRRIVDINSESYDKFLKFKNKKKSTKKNLFFLLTPLLTILIEKAEKEKFLEQLLRSFIKIYLFV